jgi:hypothetical protein
MLSTFMYFNKRDLAQYERQFSLYKRDWSAEPIARDLPYIRGKVITAISHEKGRAALTHLFQKLPQQLIPKSPSEVGTLVYIRCIERAVGSYVDSSGRLGGSAMRKDCTLSVVDIPAKVVVTRQEFIGGAPPSSAWVRQGASAEQWGGDPKWEDAIAYLVGLPQYPL